MKSTLFLTLVQILDNLFSDCSLTLVNESEVYNENSQLLNLISEATNFSPKFVLTFSNNSHTKIPSHKSSLSSLNYRTLSRILHHMDHCIVSLLFTTTVSPDFLTFAKETITPTHLPITRKDMDYYMFISKPDTHEKLLSSNEFPNKIKFKAAIGKSNVGKVKMKTVDFFGGPNATPSIKDIPLNGLLRKKQPLDKSEIFKDFVWNLRGYQMQVSASLGIALVEVMPSGTENAKRGHWKNLMNDYLQVKFNCTYRMFISTGKEGNLGRGGTGVQLPNGTWIGVTGDLYHGRADLGFVVAATDKRMEYIGFTDTYITPVFLTFVTNQPTEVYSPLALLWAFSWNLWILILISTLATIIFLFYATNFLYQIKLENILKFDRAVMLILASFLGQDVNAEFESNPIRLVIALWSIFTLTMTNLYCSKLVTLLAFPILEIVPTTFEELASSDYSVGFMKDGDSALSTFSKSTDPVYVDLRKRMEIHNGVNLECLTKVVNLEKYSCIAYNIDITYLKERNFSDAEARQLKTSNAKTYSVFLGIGTKAHSIFRVNVGKVIGQTSPFHLPYIWNKMDTYYNIRKPKMRWWAETNQTQNLLASNNQDECNNHLSLRNIKGIFYILVGLETFSGLVFFAEFF